MTATLKVRVGQYSDAGIKSANEDSSGIRLPEGPLLTTKGVAVVIADGVSGSEAGREAAEVCVLGFLSDYYSTPESWSVKKSGAKVLKALNQWLCAQGQKLRGLSRGMVTTLSVLIIKSQTATLFHIGDTRIYRLRGNDLECLTRDHRILISSDKNYLARAMGIDVDLAIDCRSIPVETGDLFFLATDGVHEHLSNQELKSLLKETIDPEQTVRKIVSRALKNGSQDNLTCQTLQIERLPIQDRQDLYEQLTELPFPPPFSEGMVVDGYRILRELHASSRTQIYLAYDEKSGEEVVLKTPSVNFEDDADYIEHFLHEEWIGRRLNSPHILKVQEPRGRRSFFYYATESLQGQTLRQWIRDNPRPSLFKVRSIVDQIASGLRAFHRMEMVHQDLKPENIMIDLHDTVKIIDFGSSKIAGIEEISVPWGRNHLLGTQNYTAPECLQGYRGSERSDLFSLGVITYEMLTGTVPYQGNIMSGKRSEVRYRTAMSQKNDVPVWVDGALEKAVQSDPRKRYDVISEFLYDLSHPNTAFLKEEPLPLLKRNPAAFWRGLAVLLLILNFFLLYFLTR